MSENRHPLNPSSPNDADREAALALVAAYCLGAADPEESQLVEAKAAEYPEVAAELAEYQRLSVALHYTVPPAAPPPDLFQRIMAAAADTGAAAVPRMPPKPASTAAPVQTPTAPPKRVPLIFRYSPAVAAAAILLLIITNVAWLTQVNQLRSDQQTLATRVNDQNTLLQALGARESNRVELQLVSQPEKRDTYASVMWGPTAGDQSWAVLVYAKNFPVLAVDKVYQLWLIRGDQPVSAGLFQVDANGTAVYRFESSQPIGKFEKLGITEEPAGGSPAPTSAPLVLGNV